MSDEDEQEQKNSNTQLTSNHRRLAAIKLKLHELTREKTKYNVEKLIQDSDFLQSEIDHFRQDIRQINNDINASIQANRTLYAEMTNFQSHAGLRYSTLEVALKDRESYQKELEKSNKNEKYRNLAREKIQSIDAAVPQLRRLDEYKARIKAAEDNQDSARKKREKLEEMVNTKLRKKAEIKQFYDDSAIRLPQIEQEIEKLRSEREEISHLSTNIKKSHQQQRHSELIQSKLFESTDRSSFEDHRLDYEQRLIKIRLLKNYFEEKMSEHRLKIDEKESFDLISPLYQTDNCPIAMRLPRTFSPLVFSSSSPPTTNNEILHSPHHQENSIEYKKELPQDILEKYSGTNKKEQTNPTFLSARKNKKNRKNFTIKHSSQMLSLYDEVRTLFGGNDETFPSMPMYEFDLLPTVKSLQLIEESVQSYLNELNQENRSLSSSIYFDDHHENESIRDSALDTHSETSSLIEPTNILNESNPNHQPEQRSSSSSSEKKTIVSSPSSSNHSHSKNVPLTPLQESILPSPIINQIDQIERQISDEGYRSIRNENPQSNSNDLNFNSTDKVDHWLSTHNDYSQSNQFNNNNNNIEEFKGTEKSS